MTADREFVLKQFQLTDTVISKLDIYVSMLEQEQAKMNLVSNSTLPIVWTRHVLDSMQLFQYLLPTDKVIVDLGSGAGFPALVLAAMDMEQKREFHLIESDGKKCRFLESIIKACTLNATIHNERIEKMQTFTADVITARALAALDKLIGYAAPFIGKDTRCIFMKGKKTDEEVKAAHKKWQFNIEKQTSISSDEGRLLFLSEVKKK